MEIEKGFASYMDYIIKYTVGMGAQGKVKLAIKNDQKVALKFIKHFSNDIQKELEIHRNLNHPYLVQLLDYHCEQIYTKKNGKTLIRSCLVYEYQEGGELFEYIAQTGRFREEVARYFFQQLIQLLQYLHGRGVAHRDLKPENILFQDGIMKVTDLGFATFMGGKAGDGILGTFKGTKGYMAPEIMSKQTYNGQSVDIFASGVILYIMITGQLPFSQAIAKDQFYNLICTNRQDQFWAFKEKQLQCQFNPDLKQLLNSLLAFDPLQRLTLSEIISCEWYQGTNRNGCRNGIETIENVRQSLESRKMKIDAQLEIQRLRKQVLKQQPNQQLLNVGIGKFNRGAQNGNVDLLLERKLKKNKPSNLRVYICPKMLFNLLIEQYEQFCNKIVNVSDTTYQFNYYYLGSNNEEQELQIQLIEMGDGFIGINFQTIKGMALENYQKKIQIEDYILSLLKQSENQEEQEIQQ